MRPGTRARLPQARAAGLSPRRGRHGQRADKAQPSLGEQPAGDHVGGPVHPQVDAARADPGSGQQRRGPGGSAADPGSAHAGADGQHGEGGVLRQEAEPLRLGQPRPFRRARPGDRPGQHAPHGRPAGHGQAATARAATRPGARHPPRRRRAAGRRPRPPRRARSRPARRQSRPGCGPPGHARRPPGPHRPASHPQRPTQRRPGSRSAPDARHPPGRSHRHAVSACPAATRDSRGITASTLASARP